MDFFSHQDQARRNTMLLIFLYITSIVLLVTAICFLFLLFMPDILLTRSEFLQAYSRFSHPWWLEVWRAADWSAIGFLALIITSFILLASLFKVFELASGGGAMIAKSLGGRRLDSRTRDEKEKRLCNVVEEMALASGIAVPEVYILDQEGAINAFAAGTAFHQAVIGVTRGTLEKLTREELQGVIAHEFSHIVNGDMKLNVRLMGVLFGILCIQQIGYFLLRSHRGQRRNKESGGIILLGFGFFTLGFIGYIFGNLIKAAVSRQREFLADAAAVQYTRNPSGIAGALKKIGGFGSQLSSERATEVSHMFFATGVQGFSANAFSTHPKLKTRIKRIDSSFQGEGIVTTASSSRTSKKEAAIAGFAGQAKTSKYQVSKFINQIGTTSPKAIEQAHDFLSYLPESIINAIHEPRDAPAVIYAILMGDEPGHQEKQMATVRAALGSKVSERVDGILHAIKPFGTRARLPLLDLSIPALKQVPQNEQQELVTMAQKIVMADEKYELFEYALLAVLKFNILPRKVLKQEVTIKLAYSQAAAIVLAALADVGHDSAKARRRAFASGMAKLQPSSSAPPRFEIKDFDFALRRLASLSYQHKKVLIEACAIVVADDGMVSATEMEVLRAVTDSLSCPIPTFT